MRLERILLPATCIIESTFNMSSSFPFGSGLLRELLKQTKAPKLSIGAQKWAEETESKHALDLIANPCVDFSPEETGQANQYLHFIQENLGLNLIELSPGLM